MSEDQLKQCPKCGKPNYQCKKRSCGKVGCQTKGCENRNFESHGYCHTCFGQKGMVHLGGVAPPSQPNQISQENQKPSISGTEMVGRYWLGISLLISLFQGKVILSALAIAIQGIVIGTILIHVGRNSQRQNETVKTIQAVSENTAADELAKLAKLLKDEYITQAEFDTQKAKLLAE